MELGILGKVELCLDAVVVAQRKDNGYSEYAVEFMGREVLAWEVLDFLYSGQHTGDVVGIWISAGPLVSSFKENSSYKDSYSREGA